jgi:ppGpp synthetase/RelA/SpoT-type nucleotidyltranferase
MTLPMSKSQLEKLGLRLRKAETPSADDLQLLEKFRAAHDPALASVDSTLRAMGLHPTSRLKTVGTIIDKLVREKTRLGTMHDVAGVRIVENVTLGGQDELVEMILAEFGGAVIDRRAIPSHGYRAVHVVVQVQECYVEIQVRTLLQNLWAQIMETLGDRAGRGVRYGQLPTNPRWAAFAENLLAWGDLIAQHETVRAELERQEGHLASWSLDPEAEAVNRQYQNLKLDIEARELSWRQMLQGMLKDLEEGIS